MVLSWLDQPTGAQHILLNKLCCASLQSTGGAQVGWAAPAAVAAMADHLNNLGYEDAAKLMLQNSWGAADLQQICKVNEAVSAFAAIADACRVPSGKNMRGSVSYSKCASANHVPATGCGGLHAAATGTWVCCHPEVTDERHAAGE